MSFNDWSDSIDITIQASQVDADLTDFPVYVDLADLGSSFFSVVKSDGGDIRVSKSDGTTEVPIQIVDIDTGAETGQMHFKADGTLSSSSDTTFKIYFGNAAANLYSRTDTYGSDNVWNSNYEAVYHLEEEPTSATAIKDSTSNAYDSTSIDGSMTAADSVSAQIGSGIDTDGSNDTIDLPNIPPTTSITCEAWVQNNGTQGLWFAHDNVGAERKWYMQHAAGWFFVNVFNDSNQNKNYYYPSVTIGDMNHYAFTFTSNTLKMYVNGQNITGSVTKVFDNTVNTLHNVTSNTTIGATAVNRFPAGVIIDEARISNNVRSDDWISTQYNNQSDTTSFYSVAGVGPSPEPDNAILFGFVF